MARIIICDGTQYPDPDPNLKIEEIQQMLSSFLPEMATAEMTESKQDEDTVYRFTKRVGVKG